MYGNIIDPKERAAAKSLNFHYLYGRKLTSRDFVNPSLLERIIFITTKYKLVIISKLLMKYKYRKSLRDMKDYFKTIKI